MRVGTLFGLPVTTPNDRCVFCDRPSQTHGQQYSDQVGTHAFTRQDSRYTHPARPITVPRND